MLAVRHLVGQGQEVNGEQVDSSHLGYDNPFYSDVQDLVRRSSDLLSEEGISTHDFVAGWELLFDRLFSGKTGLLRDVAFSSHANAPFHGYNFPDYPRLVRHYIVHHGHGGGVKVKFMIVCNPIQVDGVHERAEEFLEEILKIKFPGIARDSLLESWERGELGSRPWVDIMITNRAIIDEVSAAFRGADFSCPFNVYGDGALSRSKVEMKAEGGSVPSPHLNIILKHSVVEKFAELFDSVWQRSEEFRALALGGLTPDEKRRGLGSGTIFDLWSCLVC